MTETPPVSSTKPHAIPAKSVNIEFSPIELNSVTLNSEKNTATCAAIKRLVHSHAIFHKFIITNGSRYYKDFVLKLVIQASYPNELVPVKYEKLEADACFYARACGLAIEKFCRDGLVVENPHGDNLQLIIILGVLRGSECEVNISYVLSSVIKKRYNAESSSLNLKDFHNDPELVDAIFVPLSQPRIFEFVMGVCKRTLGPQRVTSISLANNELSVMKTLDLLPCVLLSQLNLSYNKFSVIEDLAMFRSAQLLEINLDNNPLCQEFDDEMSYISKVRQFLPMLTTLDGIKISDQGIPTYKRHYLSSSKGGPLVDQFLQHFFDLYDGSNRRKLYGVYHTDAQFSLTVTYVPKQTTSATSQLVKYMEQNRNLMKMSNYARAHQLLFQGQGKIIELLCKLAPTQHDPHSFTVDLPFYTDDKALINVIGVFKDTGLLRSFHRSFLLNRTLTSPVGDEWQIVNDMLHISNAPSEEAAAAFKFPRAPPVQRPPQLMLDTSEKMQMTEIIAQITEMKPEYAQKCLQDCNWNLEEALTVFRDLFKLNSIPKDAFQRPPDMNTGLVRLV